MTGAVTYLGLSGVSIGDLYSWSSGGGGIVITAFVAPQYRIDTNSINAIARVANQVIGRENTDAILRTANQAIERDGTQAIERA